MKTDKTDRTEKTEINGTGRRNAGGTNRIVGRGFLARTLMRFSELFENELYNNRYASMDGLWQAVDARMKVIVSLMFIVAANSSRSLAVLIGTGITAAVFAGTSRLNLRDYLRRVWKYLPVLVFVFSLPGASSWLIKGTPLLTIGPVYFTEAGLLTALRAALRTGDSLSFAFLLLASTRWADLMAGLSRMHIPDGFIAILNMAYRYIFLMASAGTEMMQARYLRTVGKISSAENRKYVGGAFGQLFVKVRRISEEVYQAMVLRGYQGTFAGAERRRLRMLDYLFLIVGAVILMILIIGGYIFG